MKSALKDSSISVKLLLSFIYLVSCANLLLAAGPAVRPASEISNDTIDWMKKVADWQLTQSAWDSSVSWERGALHAGLMACYEATKDETYLEKCRQWAEKFDWQLGWNNSNHADNMACAQAYIELYFLDEQNPYRYQDFKNQSDAHVALNPVFNCDTTSDSNVWWWCDALFMAPPGLVRLSRATQDSDYIDFMHRMWADTQSCLYDTEDHLFFRDIGYFWPDYNYNGEKVFWSRGNGWVLAGTARMLQYLPLEDTNRPGYITLLQEMSAALKEIQQPDGYWHSDLLSPDHYDNPETSGTGFFTFGIAWGVNNGFLDEAACWPTVEAGWQALKAAVQPSGLLGWVQPVGADPRGTSATTTDVFGVGAYLLAGSEVLKYRLANDPNSIEYFESYTTDAALRAAWTDGTTNSTSSQIALGDYGDNFMELTYQNDQPPYRSETVHTFASPKNLMLHDNGYLSVLVRGNAASAAEPVYLRLEDTAAGAAVQIMADTTVVTTPQWMELAFPLADFTGIDLTQIRKLTIGVGLPDAASPAGQGAIRIDNIRLYPRQCIAAQEDLVTDCRINLLDVAVMAAQWMDEYAETVEPVDPGTGSLTAYWAFDDVDNGFAYDSVVQAYNAEFRSNSVWEQTAGKSGGAARIDGSSNSRSRVEIPAAGLSVEACTVALWIRPEGSQSSPSTRYIFGHTSPATSWGNRIQLYLDNGDTRLDAGLGDTHLLSTNNDTVPTDEWTHVALTWDGVKYQVYVNGLLTSSGTYSGLSTLQTVAHIGNHGYYNPYEGFNGLMDEVRIYNTVLSPSNMLYLAEQEGYTRIPDPRPADLIPDGRIDFNDLRELLDKWMQENYWP